MSGPFKMKYTNGKKADSSAFPFSKAPLQEPPVNTIGGSSAQEIVGKKIDDEIERTVVSSIDSSKLKDVIDVIDKSSN